MHLSCSNESADKDHSSNSPNEKNSFSNMRAKNRGSKGFFVGNPEWGSKFSCPVKSMF